MSELSDGFASVTWWTSCFLRHPFMTSTVDPGCAARDSDQGRRQRSCDHGLRVRSVEMTDRTYRVTEIVGTSGESIDQAIRNGIRRASETLRHLDWFEVTEVRGHIDAGEVAHFQVGMKEGFHLKDA